MKIENRCIEGRKEKQRGAFDQFGHRWHHIPDFYFSKVLKVNSRQKKKLRQSPTIDRQRLKQTKWYDLENEINTSRITHVKRSKGFERKGKVSIVTNIETLSD